MIMPSDDGGDGCIDADAQWRLLSEVMHDSAEGFALTDPGNACFYRREARQFCSRCDPLDEDEVSDRYFEAAALRERWSDRFTGRVCRIPR